MFNQALETTENFIAILEVQDVEGNVHTYEIYMSGIKIVYDEVNGYAEYHNQTYILDLLDSLSE